MRVLSTLLAVLVLAAASPSQPPTLQAPIDPAHVVRNDGPRCAWVSLATLANRAGRADLARAAAGHPGQMRTTREAWDCCRECGVAVEFCRQPADLDGFLTWHLACGRPVAVGVVIPEGPHAILVTHFERNKTVGVLDCNNGRPRTLTWAEWLALRPSGMGYCLLIDGAREPRPEWAEAKPAVVPTVVVPTVPQPQTVAPVYVHPQAQQMPRYVDPSCQTGA